MFTTVSGTELALISIAAVALFIVRQFQTRRVASPWNVLLPLGLAYFGAQGLALLDPGGWAMLGVNLSLGLGLGFARGTTLRVWVDERGEALVRGTGLTLALWLATFAARVVVGVAEYRFGLGSGSMGTAVMLLPISATLAAQSLVAYLRSRDLSIVTA